MVIIIQTPDVKARKSLLELINQKMQKFGHLTDRLIETRVCLRLDKSDTTENKICEIKVVIPGNDLFTVKRARTFPEAVRKACDTMQRQINDWKSKVRPYRKSHSQGRG